MRWLLAAVLLAACSKDPAPAPGTGSGTNYEALGKKPANARRPTAPPDIEKNALAVGAKVPALEVVDASGAKWTLADALTKHKRVMLVFYRGDW